MFLPFWCPLACAFLSRSLLGAPLAFTCCFRLFGALCCCLYARPPSQCLPAILKADFHGCIMSVVRSRCPTYIGVSGIVLQETEKTFRVITRDDKLVGGCGCPLTCCVFLPSAVFDWLPPPLFVLLFFFLRFIPQPCPRRCACSTLPLTGAPLSCRASTWRTAARSAARESSKRKTQWT